ncbi:MAG TPA: enoyl-CoA hydratase/isomerase family protein [Bacillota bacterium]
MGEPYVLYEVKDGICTLTLNNPAKRNAGTVELQRDLEDAVTRADRDPEVRVVILTGKGPAFMAGADLNLIERAEPLEYRNYTMVWRRLRHQMLSSAKPVIAAVNGYAYGAGSVIAWSCDLVVAAEEAKFGLQEILLGQFAAASFLPRAIGRMRAAELILLGKPITAQRAFELGLVNWVVPLEELLPTARSIAAELAAKVPRSVAWAKQLLRWQSDMPEAIADLVEVELNALTFTDPEKRRVTREYVERVRRKS